MILGKWEEIQREELGMHRVSLELCGAPPRHQSASCAALNEKQKGESHPEVAAVENVTP